MNILFLDMVAPKAYTCTTLRTEALGGSEASLLRVARGLAKEGHSVYLFQGVDPNRTRETIDGIMHVNTLDQFDVDVVIHMRTAQYIPDFKEAYPHARHIVWMHDLAGEWLKDEPLEFAEIVCVSDFHTQQFRSALESLYNIQSPHQDGPKIHRIYNPVEVDGMRYPKMPGRLGFFSSPHKGLSQVIDVFVNHLANGRAPDDPVPELVIANPGYLADSNTAASGVVNLGQLPHHRVMEEMSRCQVLLYPQTVFPETFGLVLAEANAMGTPVLCHNFGAAKEVLTKSGNPEVRAIQENNSVIDCTNPELVAEVLKDMLSTVAITRADERFHIDAVIAEWKKLLQC